MRESSDYATVRIRLKAGATTREAFADASDRLDSLGALLADDDSVGGVELRDPTTLESSERAELVVYTVPGAVDDVRAAAQVLANSLELDVVMRSEQHLGDAWRDRWKEFYGKTTWGDGALLLRPSWIERADDDPEREVVIDPGRAFGTGLHATTQLCLQALADLRAGGFSARTVLDLGCGSGILSLAAARLFDRARVVAIDVDPEATAATQENVELNDLSERVEVLTGDVSSHEPDPAELVLANIRPEVLSPLAPTLASLARGKLILSGILDEETDAVARAYDAAGFGAPTRLDRGGWTALIYDPVLR